MQVPSVPPPIITNAVPQDVVARAVPNTQAVQPLIQNAVDPSPKSEKSDHSKTNRDGSRGRDKERSEDDEADEKEPEHTVNISV